MRTYASDLLLLFHSYYLLPFRLLLPVQRYRMIEEHNIEAVTVHNSTARANVMESSVARLLKSYG
jgi:hypothetical protein